MDTARVFGHQGATMTGRSTSLRTAASRAVLAAFVMLASCGGGPGELYETAQFEELQKNPAHARELYEQLRRRYPDSPEAGNAAERLRALDGQR
jgi:TolA-binding protein